MGISSSTTNSPTQLQSDIQRLGDRFPFGDEELVLVYCAYQRLIHGDIHTRTIEPPVEQKEDLHQSAMPASCSIEIVSFLTDIGVSALDEQLKQQQKKPFASESVSTSTENPLSQLEERRILLQAVEQKILPRNFGNCLYQQCFLRPSDSSQYDEEKQAVEDGVVDDFTRMARLEKFFEGLSNGTRRGAKSSIQCMIRCCTPCDPPAVQEISKLEAPPTFVPNGFSQNGAQSGTNTTVIPTADKRYIRPLEFVSLGYRVGLATAFLKATTTPKKISTEEEEEDVPTDFAQFIPPKDESEVAPGLQALANSLAELSLKRRQRTYRTSTPYSHADLVDQAVDEEDIMEWAEQVAPMFGSILPTFLHLVFFPNIPLPPSRTSFEYPRTLLSQNTSIFSHGHSPLLFSFGCTSSALGGEVR